MPVLARSLVVSMLVVAPAVAATAQPLAFATTDHPSALGARAIVTADFNRDGWPDVAHAGQATSTLSMLLNTQGEGFAAAIAVPIGSGAFDLTTGDFNRDGVPDLAVANADSDSLSILLGRGDGGFIRRDISSGAARSPRGLTATDINRDGKVDLICAGYDGGAVVILVGDGAGGFAIASTLGPATQPQGVSVADFDHDGRLDVAVAQYAAEGLVVWFGTAGGFVRFAVPGASQLNLLAAGDLNRDGWMDIAAAGTYTRRVAVYLGSASGLAYTRSYSMDADPRGLSLGDVNHDGALDVIAATRDTSTVNVLRGDPAHPGSFLPRLSFPAGAGSRAVTAADFDHDGRLDLVTGNQYAATVSILENTTALLPAAYTFGRLTSAAGVPLSRTGGLAAADFNRDGVPDLVQRVGDSSGVAVVMSDGRTVVLPDPGADGGHVVGDFNGDGHLDVAHVNGGMVTSLGDGRGRFTASLPTPVSPGSACAPGDMNRDGRLDLVCSHGTVMLGNGDGTFRIGGEFSAGQRPLVVDVNADGKLDLVDASGVVCFGDGAGGSSSCAYPGIGIPGADAAVADLNHDAYPDLVFSDGKTDFAVTLGTADGYVGGIAWSSSEGVGEATHFAVADVNADGHEDLLINLLHPTAGTSGILRVLPGRGDGTFQSAETFALTAGEIAVADVTRDGLPDVLAAAGAQIDVLVNRRGRTNHPPVVTTQEATVDRLGCVTFPVDAIDPDQHAVSIHWSGDVTPRGQVPRLTSATACVDAPGVYHYQLSVSDDRGAVVSRTVTFSVVGPREIVLHMNDATPSGSGEWSIVSDPSAAAGLRAYNRNLGAPKRNTPLAQSGSHVELSFLADPTQAYKLWLRLSADGNHWGNDSVWVQFSGATDAAGRPVYRIGTTSGLAVNIEECLTCRASGWGWEDDGWGSVDRNGALLRFPGGGLQRIRIQTREDGVSVDQVVLSAAQYLTTRPGAARNDATILNASTRGPAFDVLVNFRCGTIGCVPNGPFFQASDGWFYGTTSEGGPGPGEGTLFRMNRDGTLQLLPVPVSRGEFLSLSFFEARDGFFYGVGGEDPNVIVRMNHEGVATVLHEFDTGGAVALVEARDGFFYGMTAGDGDSGDGTVFRMDAAGDVTVLRALDEPIYLLAFFEAADGLFYGTTYGGMVFRMNRSGVSTVVHRFDAPLVSLVQASDGFFYGTASDGCCGGANTGIVFRMDGAGHVTVLHVFDPSTGVYPYAGPIEGRDGFLYGLTHSGGAFGSGTIYRMTRAGAVTVLHSFDGANGAGPAASLVQGDDGALYGTTAFGGTYGHGVVFRIVPPAR